MNVRDIDFYHRGARRHMGCSCFDIRHDYFSEETLIWNAIFQYGCEGRDLILISIALSLPSSIDLQLRPSS